MTFEQSHGLGTAVPIAAEGHHTPTACGIGANGGAGSVARVTVQTRKHLPRIRQFVGVDGRRARQVRTIQPGRRGE